MVELVYFGMFPVILFFTLVAHNLGFDIFDDIGIFIYTCLLILWPLSLIVALFALVVFVAYQAINWLAEKTARIIERMMTK